MTSSFPLIFYGARAKGLQFLLAGLVLGCAATCRGWAADAGANSTSPVVWLREFELKRGVRPEEFEGFVKRELSQALSVDKTGARLRVFRGDRGNRKGRYILIWEFESVAARNQCFPKEGAGSSDSFKPTWKRIKLSLQKFSNYVNEKDDYTDYVAVTD